MHAAHNLRLHCLEPGANASIEMLHVDSKHTTHYYTPYMNGLTTELI